MNPQYHTGDNTLSKDALHLSGINMGSVTSAGAFENNYTTPPGFSVAKDSTGVYTVTHNMDLRLDPASTASSSIDDKYSVVVSCKGSTAAVAMVDTVSYNSFKVRTFDSAGTATDAAFNFYMNRPLV